MKEYDGRVRNNPYYRFDGEIMTCCFIIMACIVIWWAIFTPAGRHAVQAFFSALAR